MIVTAALRRIAPPAAERMWPTVAPTVWRAVSAGSAVLAAASARRAATALWPGDHDPRDPSDPAVAWSEALAWGILAGAAAGSARVVARRGATAGWRRATGDQPPA